VNKRNKPRVHSFFLVGTEKNVATTDSFSSRFIHPSDHFGIILKIAICEKNEEV